MILTDPGTYLSIEEQLLTDTIRHTLNIPFISIIIPCFNQGHFLSDCLDSILQQSFSDWEAIVVNDGSTDNTSSVVAEFQKKDRRVQYVEKKNGGLSSARNAGIEKAKGGFFLFLDADDWLECNAFDKINWNDDADLFQWGYRYYLNDKAQYLHTVHPCPQGELLPFILKQNIGPVHSILASRRVVEMSGFFDESLKSVEDWDYWIRVAKQGARIKQLSTVGVAYRLTEDSMSKDPFRMYFHLSIVLNQAVSYDKRLPDSIATNRFYPEIDFSEAIKPFLATCLGLAIMQNRIEQSIELFRAETATHNIRWKLSDFKNMCSYLTFRYRYKKPYLNWVIAELVPQFRTFFYRIGFKGVQLNIIMNFVFHYHYSHVRRNRSPFLGQVYNRIFSLIYLAKI